MSNPEDRINAPRATDLPALMGEEELYPSERRRREQARAGAIIGMMLFSVQPNAKKISLISQSIIMVAITLTIALRYAGAI